MAGRRPHGHWPAARAFYVEGTDVAGVRAWPSLAAVAVRFGIPPDSVRRRAAAERWTGARETWQAAYSRLLREARRETLVRESALFDDAILRASRALVGLLDRQIGAAAAAGEKASPAHLRAVAHAMLDVQRASKVALGEATDHSTIEAPAGAFTFIGGPRAADDGLDAGGAEPA